MKSDSAPLLTPVLPPAQPPRVDTRVLLQGARELLIEHAGECYRLRITRQNKLILTK